MPTESVYSPPYAMKSSQSSVSRIRSLYVKATSLDRFGMGMLRLGLVIVQELLRRCGVKASDVVVSITQNADEDWSFGYGRAQFITGEL
jgi:Tautomerase enzyme